MNSSSDGFKEHKNVVAFAGEQSSAPPVHWVGDVIVKVTATAGHVELPVQQLMDLKPGQTITLDAHANAPIEVMVSGKLVAYGVLVVVGDNYGVRITEIVAA